MENERELNKLVIVGNGFDRAHGLKTSYGDFLDWYFVYVFNQFKSAKNYVDELIKIEMPLPMGTKIDLESWRRDTPKTKDDVLKSLRLMHISYKSDFFKNILHRLSKGRWVDIELAYYEHLKYLYLNKNTTPEKKIDRVTEFNKKFTYIIQRFSEYISIIDLEIDEKQLDINSRYNLKDIIKAPEERYSLLFLNFNYTSTLFKKYHIEDEEVNHINGRVKYKDENPIIFGYGDESDPLYQQIEDTGDNVYLEHIKSFGYFQTPNYHNLLSFIESASFNCYIVGHSCGLSDRVLLRQIFEHDNCRSIDIFYHERADGTDNFKEITQEMSRHFRPQNKHEMRKKILNKNSKNIIPQLRV